MRRPGLVLFVVLALLGAAGCGLGGDDGGSTGDGVTLRVTEDFGSERVTRASEARVPQGDTVMRLLQRKVDVQTRFGGGFVGSLEGRGGGEQDGRPTDWFFYVNGIESRGGRRGVRAHAGRPGVVGPARLGHRDADPRRGRVVPRAVPLGLPRQADPRAHRVRAAAGPRVRRGRRAPRRRGREGHLALRASPSARRAASCVCSSASGASCGWTRPPSSSSAGPRAPGVYARFDAAGRRLTVLDPRGRPARTLTSGAGLVAATRQGDARPTWIVTGTDAVGLAAAAAALEESLLAQRFAVAIENGQAVPAPVTVPGIGSP